MDLNTICAYIWSRKSEAQMQLKESAKIMSVVTNLDSKVGRATE
jgi:hypothetical protein